MKRSHLLLLTAISLFAISCRRGVQFELEAEAISNPVVANATQVSDPNVSTIFTAGRAWESTIAISPARPNIVLATGIKMKESPNIGGTCPIYRSEDGGKTWSEGMPLTTIIDGLDYANQGDPVLAFDRTGTAYLALLLYGPNAGHPLYSSLAVYKSTDDGLTWRAVALTKRTPQNNRLPIFDDKEWLAADTSGTATDGNLYLIWARADGYNDAHHQEMVFSRSTDHGESWSEPMLLEGGGIGFVAVGPQGNVYISYSAAGTNGYSIRKSTDGGLTFGARSTAALSTLPSSLPNADIQLNVLQQLAVDNSTGPGRGNLYFIYPSSADGASGGPAQVRLTRSTNEGRTWEAPLVLSGSGDAFLPAITTDEVTGDVIASWFDRRDDPSNTRPRIYGARSHNGGRTFEIRPFTSTVHIEGISFLGHYDAATARDGVALRAFSNNGGYLAAVKMVWPEIKRHRPVSGVAPPPATSRVQ